MKLLFVLAVVGVVAILYLVGDAMERADKKTKPWRRPGDGGPE